MGVEPETYKRLVGMLVANSAEEVCGSHPILAID
jgi:hypothetical protein